MITTKKELIEEVNNRMEAASNFLNRPDGQPSEDDLWIVLQALDRAKKAVAEIINGDYRG